MVEWLKAPVLKTGEVQASVGSNPTLSVYNIKFMFLFKKNEGKFYKKNLPWTKKFINNNIHIIEKNYELYPFRNKWNCNCHSIHDYETDTFKIDYNFLRKMYEKVSKDVCKKFNVKYNGMSDIWYNYYKRGQYQEPHIHEGNGFTAVHYLLFNSKLNPETKFTDPKIKLPKVKRGDIVFFPNQYEHYVLPNSSDFPRLTVAFTLNVL